MGNREETTSVSLRHILRRPWPRRRPAGLRLNCRFKSNRRSWNGRGSLWLAPVGIWRSGWAEGPPRPAIVPNGDYPDIGESPGDGVADRKKPKD